MSKFSSSTCRLGFFCWAPFAGVIKRSELKKVATNVSGEWAEEELHVRFQPGDSPAVSSNRELVTHPVDDCEPTKVDWDNYLLPRRVSYSATFELFLWLRSYELHSKSSCRRNSCCCSFLNRIRKQAYEQSILVVLTLNGLEWSSNRLELFQHKSFPLVRLDMELW